MPLRFVTTFGKHAYVLRVTCRRVTAIKLFPLLDPEAVGTLLDEKAVEPDQAQDYRPFHKMAAHSRTEALSHLLVHRCASRKATEMRA
jgi:hypothetical protein